MDISWGTALYQLVAFFVMISFITAIILSVKFFIRSTNDKQNLQKIDQKLDKIIDLLEKNK